MSTVLSFTLGMGQFTRILLVVGFIVPIGIPFGIPFPLGIKALNSRAPNLIPWAWGVNGFMTVVGSLLAVILSMKIGFTATLLVSLAVYLIAMLSFGALTRKSYVRTVAEAPRGQLCTRRGGFTPKVIILPPRVHQLNPATAAERLLVALN